MGFLSCSSKSGGDAGVAKAESSEKGKNLPENDALILDNTLNKLDEGRQVFRFDTFGDEDFWGGALRIHEAIEGTKFGGVGDGVSPNTALAVGLKVDIDALPQKLIQD